MENEPHIPALFSLVKTESKLRSIGGLLAFVSESRADSKSAGEGEIFSGLGQILLDLSNDLNAARQSLDRAIVTRSKCKCDEL